MRRDCVSTLDLGGLDNIPQDSCYVEGGVGSMLEEALNPGDHRRWRQGHWTAHAQGGSFPATLGERGPDPQMLGLHAPAIGSWTRVTTAQVPMVDPAADAGAPSATSMDSAVGPPVSFAPSLRACLPWPAKGPWHLRHLPGAVPAPAASTSG